MVEAWTEKMKAIGWWSACCGGDWNNRADEGDGGNGMVEGRMKNGGGVAGGCLTQPSGEGGTGWPPEEVARLDAPGILHARRAGELVRPGQAVFSGMKEWRCV